MGTARARLDLSGVWPAWSDFVANPIWRAGAVSSGIKNQDTISGRRVWRHRICAGRQTLSQLQQVFGAESPLVPGPRLVESHTDIVADGNETAVAYLAWQAPGGADDLD